MSYMPRKKTNPQRFWAIKFKDGNYWPVLSETPECQNGEIMRMELHEMAEVVEVELKEVRKHEGCPKHHKGTRT